MVNTQDYFLAQNRPRLYIQAVQRRSMATAAKLTWPSKIPYRLTGGVRSCLTGRATAPGRAVQNKTAVRALRAAACKVKAMKLDLSKTPCVFDTGASKGFCVTMVDCFPTITASRAVGQRLRLTSMRRSLGVHELARLQGIVFPRTLETRQSEVLRCIGKAMRQNVLQCTLRHLLASAGFLEQSATSLWHLAAEMVNAGLVKEPFCLPGLVYDLAK